MGSSAIRAIAAQGLGLLVALAVSRLLPLPGLWALLALQAAAAALISQLVGQAAWWVPMHLLFLPAAVGLLALQLPPVIYLLVFVGLALVFWGTAQGDVPLFLSSSEVARELARIIQREGATRFAELGAGVGTVVLPLARRHPQLEVEAWEKAPLPWAIMRVRCRQLRHVKVYRQSFWECDFSHYDVVFAFLSPLPMSRLGEKVQREMRPGTLLVSSSFAVPGWQPEETLQLSDARGTLLYCYRVKST